MRSIGLKAVFYAKPCGILRLVDFKTAPFASESYTIAVFSCSATTCL